MRPGGTSEQGRIEAEVAEVRLSEHVVWKLKIRDEDWVLCLPDPYVGRA